MTDQAKNFMSNMKNMELPEVLKSNSSSNEYQVIASKGETKLAISVVPMVSIIDGRQVVCLGLRLLEKKAPGQALSLFTGFKTRSEQTYTALDGSPAYCFLGEKHVIPLCLFPISGKELFAFIHENKILEQVRGWLTGRILQAGGTVTVSDLTFDSVLASKLESIPTESLMLFKLPIIKGFNDVPETPETPDENPEAGPETKPPTT